MHHNINQINILFLRQLKRYGRSKVRIISSLGQPLLFLIGFWLGFGPIFQQAGQGNYLDFLVPGIIAMGIMMNGMFTGIEVIWDKQFGFLKETLVAPVSRLIIVLGRTLGGATVSTFQGLIILIVTLFIGFKPQGITMFFLALFVMFIIAVIFTGIGTAIASILEDMNAFPLIMNFLIMPLFFLSGALFPLAKLPKFVTIITYFNPLSYGVDALRGTLTGVYHFSLILDLTVLGICTIIIFIISSFLFNRIQS